MKLKAMVYGIECWIMGGNGADWSYRPVTDSDWGGRFLCNGSWSLERLYKSGIVTPISE